MTESYRAPNPVPLFRKQSQELDADTSFILSTLVIIDGGGRLESEKVADMRVLIDAYLTDTGRESLGWMRKGTEI
ncbi:hypothetical protein I2483_13715 [Sporosarcina sp. E16_3]|uniref:hypothetical protein n=1 Tax=Sporosarcina sp. E16_3 TaxID=2789293 RepID=UPI001A928C84|nr:hypothetical protein [Sporosarcina sp. E16_3]MBO0602720.1 hypothetical protein [Sporosarcina sp. E16_3]